MLGKTALRWFLAPGNLACDLIGAREDDDRAMIRTIVNMLVWNLVIIVVVALVVW